jgi:hypothetical protein
MTSARHRPGLYGPVILFCLAACVGCSAPSGQPADTPAMIFFTDTPGSGEVEAPEVTTAPATPPNGSQDSGAPAMIIFTATPWPAGAPGIGADGVEPALTADATRTGIDATNPALPASTGIFPTTEFTRVALRLTPAATDFPPSTGPVTAPDGTAVPRGAQNFDDQSVVVWPHNWALGVAFVVLIIIIIWFFGRRRG